MLMIDFEYHRNSRTILRIYRQLKYLIIDVVLYAYVLYPGLTGPDITKTSKSPS
jgi:hypothetical protein